MTLRRWARAACSAASGSWAQTASMMARCSGRETPGRPFLSAKLSTIWSTLQLDGLGWGSGVRRPAAATATRAQIAIIVVQTPW